MDITLQPNGKPCGGRIIIPIVEMLCGARAHDCKCGLTFDHEEEAHVCLNSLCNGSWVGDIDGDDFRVICYPLMHPR